MSTQPGLDFEGVATRIENARVREPANGPVCLREGCGKPRPEGAKPGQYCSYICRREASRERAEERRDRGKAIAASNHAPELELARRLALELLATRGPGTIADLREYAAEREIELTFHLPWSANVFRSGKELPEWFEPTGERIATRHLRGNARKVNEYRLTPDGWTAYQGTKRI